MTDDFVPGLEDTQHTPARVADRPRRKKLRWTLGILGVLLLVLGGAGAGVLWLASNALDKATHGRGGSPVGIFVPLPLPNEESGVANVLIAGNSYDDPGHGGSTLTDSIIVASVNLKTKQTSLISIPRDLWVEHNGRQSKINAVYVYAGGGEAGLRALSEVAEKVTGLHIEQRILVGFEAVRDIVDAVGGIDVVINSPDPRGIADPLGLQLRNGPQHLDGDTALLLARARNNPLGDKPNYGLPNGDFDRQKNQRMILAAVADKAKSSPALANPSAVLQIFDTVGKNIITDLSAGQMRRFYDLVSGGPSESVSIRGASGQNLLVGYSAPGGGAALVPAAGMFEYGPIREFVAKTVGL